ncbi:MAG: septum site-determining protein MinC [Roseiflexaceae bacterium]|nr:septum site-determining protein MinC [Roseiflexaceae bacterium]
MQQLIAIKGGRGGLRLQLDESVPWEDLLVALQQQLGQGSSFFNGAQITVDVGERALDQAQLDGLLALMQEHGLKPDSLASSARESRAAARSAGVAARPLVRGIAEAEERGEALFHARTVRSGQLIRHHGNVTILGDVNAGGEIIAGGSVIVWGHVRGVVHAGALGDRNCIIGALHLVPTQLRIADLIGRQPDKAADKMPEVARVESGAIVVEPWEAFKK